MVSQLPDGVYEAASAMDDDGVLKGDPVPIRVKVTIRKGAMVIDLSGCSKERKADQFAHVGGRPRLQG